MKMFEARRLRSEQASTLLEFSLVAFMLVVSLLGVVEMGRMLLVYNTVANAARAGSRYAIVHGGERTGSGITGPSGPGSITQVQTVVRNYASAGLLNTSNLMVTVNYSDGLNTAGSPVSVTVSYPYDPLVSYFNSALSITMGSTSEGVITY